MAPLAVTSMDLDLKMTTLTTPVMVSIFEETLDHKSSDVEAKCSRTLKMAISGSLTFDALTGHSKLVPRRSSWPQKIQDLSPSPLQRSICSFELLFSQCEFYLSRELCPMIQPNAK